MEPLAKIAQQTGICRCPDYYKYWYNGSCHDCPSYAPTRETRCTRTTFGETLTDRMLNSTCGNLIDCRVQGECYESGKHVISVSGCTAAPPLQTPPPQSGGPGSRDRY